MILRSFLPALQISQNMLHGKSAGDGGVGTEPSAEKSLVQKAHPVRPGQHIKNKADILMQDPFFKTETALQDIISFKHKRRYTGGTGVFLHTCYKSFPSAVKTFRLLIREQNRGCLLFIGFFLRELPVFKSKHIQVVPDHISVHLIQRIVGDPVICIQHIDHPASGQSHGRISGSRLSSVFLMADQTDPGIHQSIFRQDLPRAIRGSIIHADHFQIDQRLGKDTQKTVFQVRCAVIDRDQHRDQRTLPGYFHLCIFPGNRCLHSRKFAPAVLRDLFPVEMYRGSQSRIFPILFLICGDMLQDPDTAFHISVRHDAGHDRIFPKTADKPLFRKNPHSSGLHQDVKSKHLVLMEQSFGKADAVLHQKIPAVEIPRLGRHPVPSFHPPDIQLFSTQHIRIVTLENRRIAAELFTEFLILIYKIRTESSHIQLFLFRTEYQFGQHVRSDHVIRIQKINIFSPGIQKSFVPDCSQSHVLFITQKPDPAVISGCFPDLIPGTILRAVIDAQDLHIRKCLAANA